MSTGILMKMNCLNHQKSPRFLRKTLSCARRMSASFVVEYLVVQHRTLLRINFLPGEWIPSVATSLTHIWSMHTMGLAAIGKPAAMSQSSPRSPNFWPTLPTCTNMMSILNCAICQKGLNFLAAIVHLSKAETCHWNQRTIKAPFPPPPLSNSRPQILTHA